MDVNDPQLDTLDPDPLDRILNGIWFLEGLERLDELVRNE